MPGKNWVSCNSRLIQFSGQDGRRITQNDKSFLYLRTISLRSLLLFSIYIYVTSLKILIVLSCFTQQKYAKK